MSMELKGFKVLYLERGHQSVGVELANMDNFFDNVYCYQLSPYRCTVMNTPQTAN